jgi:hypothetical protein
LEFCEAKRRSSKAAGMPLPGVSRGRQGWRASPHPTWRYNPGREALAPNFAKLTGLRDIKLPDQQTAYAHIAEQYRKDMDGTRMTVGEFDTLVRRITRKDYLPQNINYQVGNLESQRHEAMMKTGVTDSKIMATDSRLWHGTADKNNRQKVPETRFTDIYRLLQEPETVYEERVKNKHYRVFHFVKDTKDGRKLKVLLHLTKLGRTTTALQIRTIGYANYQYADKNLFREITW